MSTEPDFKPGHQGGYRSDHTLFCERTLVTLLRGLGPWKEAVYLAGGLVPLYLIPQAESQGEYAGTMDVDLVLDVNRLGQIDAYRWLAKNLEQLGFHRNRTGRSAQSFRWRRQVADGHSVLVDFLCEGTHTEGARLERLPKSGLTALRIPGAGLVMEEYVSVEITAPLLDDQGIVTETVRVAGVVPFLVLKTLALAERLEAKDAYDIIYCLLNFPGGIEAVAAGFAGTLVRRPTDPLLARVLRVLREEFLSDEKTSGHLKQGPTSYARFVFDVGETESGRRSRQEAVSTVEAFLAAVSALAPGDPRVK